MSKTDIESNWASVTDQSGIFAGKGGFDITVGNNTDLQGAVIASKAEDKTHNQLDTGTISFSDIENKADFDVSSMSMSIGTSGGPSPTAGMPTIYHNSGHDHSTTASAVEDGSLTVRNQDEQQQNINQLSRDTANANNPLAQLFNKQKELDKIEAIELVRDIAAQAKSIANKYDRIQAQNDINDNPAKLDELRKSAQDEYDSLPPEEKAGTSVDKLYANNYYTAVSDQVSHNKDNKNIGGMGSSLSKGIDAATSIVTGLITGDITGGLAGASAPYLANIIKESTYERDSNNEIIYENGEPKVNKAANLTAHALLGAAIAIAQGNSALAGGAGALAGEAAADFIREKLYNKDVKDLSEAEKENISALAQLAVGLAVAAGTGGNTNDVGTAVAGSKNAVENNSLTGKQIVEENTKSAEYWKDKAREVMGENVASLIVNAAITVAADGMNGTVAMVDTAGDLLAALVTCATGENYCTQAKSDLKETNDKIGVAFDAVVSGQAWEKLKQTINAAEHGDQKAQENISALLASLLVPAKAVYPGGKTGGTVNKVENVASDASAINKVENITEKVNNKLPNGYSEFESTLSAASNNKGGLPDGYRRIINDTTGETKILGSDGKIYNEVKLGDGSNSLQHLSYEPASYHGTTNNAVKNKAPTYGQDALDLSLQIKETSTRRIGVDYKTNEFVIFDNTINNTYHGHVRTWKELTQEMKNTLIKNGVTDNKGQIITR